jgi:glycosyltransferase involved in cell wall biosynthesis
MRNKIISVIIPTYNPESERFERVLDSLSNQSLDKSLWELIIVDNNSTNGYLDKLVFSIGLDYKIVKEYKQGLTWARLRGFSEATSDFIVLVDDDNLLEKSYLEIVKNEFDCNPKLGAIGGKSIGQFETDLFPSYFDKIKEMLAIRDMGEEKIYFELAPNELLTTYPDNSPIGAGMGIRKSALSKYQKEANQKQFLALDRTGDKLSSGGDNEIVLSIIQNGYGILYSPQLTLVHIIPAFRLNPSYLAKLNKDSSKSWVEILAKYKISPWKPISKWTVPLRALKAYIHFKAWQGDLNYIRWKGACGIFEGRSCIQ